MFAVEGGQIIAAVPYDPAAVAAARAIPGRYWDGVRRVTRFPLSQRVEVARWAKKFYPKEDLSALEGVSFEVGVSDLGSHFSVVTPFDPAFISEVKKLPDARWDKDGRAWVVPKDRARELCQICRGIWGADPKALVAAIAEYEASFALATATKTEDRIELPGGALFPFQVTGVRFLERKGGGLIADDMGLGKTVQSIAFLSGDKGRLPAIVVCPASVKFNWVREVHRWSGGGVKAVIADAKKWTGQIFQEKPDVLVLNYDILNRLVDDTGGVHPELVKWGLTTVIFDEAHNLKNETSQRGRAAVALAGACRHVIELTGTPVLNRPLELWNLLRMIDPGSWGDKKRFMFRYCGASKGRWGWAFEGLSNERELHDRVLGHYMVRRLKKDVLKELPPKIRSYVPVSLSKDGMKEYRDFFGSIQAKLINFGSGMGGSGARSEGLAALNQLRQLIGQRKAPLVAAWILETLETAPKVLVFAYHHSVVDIITDTLKSSGVRVARIDGRDKVEDRQAAIDGFQTGDLQVLVCGIMSVREGVTLTATDQVVFAERAWRPADHDQASDRAHRIGQDKCVNVWFFDAEGTIDEDMRALQDQKRDVIAAVVDGVDSGGEREESIALQLALRILKGHEATGG